MPPDIAAAFRDYLQGRPALTPLWPVEWNKEGAEMLRVDLDAAGIPYRDDEGLVRDFHSLRASYCSLLGRAGVSPKVTQTLARHSDINLTMNVYSHAHIHDLASAVEGLPITPPGGKRPGVEHLAATGTDGKPVGDGSKRGIGNDTEKQTAPQSGIVGKMGRVEPPFSCDGSGQLEQTGTDAQDGCDDDGRRNVLSLHGIGTTIEAVGTDRDGKNHQAMQTTPPGFEPGQREPKSLVLPLHYGVFQGRAIGV